MKVLVTGAGGFVGRHLVGQLVARGDEVVGVDRDLGADWPAALRGVTASVTDAAAMRAAAEGCDAVVHAAAVTGLWAPDPRIFERVNLGGTETVLAAAATAGATRAVLVSSYTTLIAGARSDPETEVDETLELAPEALLGAYPASKRRAELAAAGGPLPAAIVLPSAPVGPGDRTPTPPGALLRDLANGAIPAMISCGWNLIDVRALASGVLAALDRGIAGRRYLLVGEDMDTGAFLAAFERVSGVPGPRARVPYRVALTAARVEAGMAGLTGRPPRAPLTGVRLAGPWRRFSGARAAEELDFRAPPVEDALRAALLWMRERGMLTRDLPGLG
ncbi:NAD-dependent epimerase/dehydratase family protein [Paralimibaculum aggregatum]|uniref:NAD-dependent epimerase/dehydratase family protein n=1 Tax=Paralimibaculum aggregatum TaxID=3036245 RepID=A0ABQ6LD32_9RHOB|nr:NAD-dependent epimerase/dehydratase family protein [Limibaculum sp. NKW23]GMG81272.1 NAD-dependent epimerase/dehydratase family protein [Limibaculum sp. NKW23]